MADLRDAIDASDEPLVSVDCSDVTFMDSSGFHAMVDATEYAARRGHTLVIREPSPPCRRLIRLCDWAASFVEGAAPAGRPLSSSRHGAWQPLTNLARACSGVEGDPDCHGRQT
jgi:hypothetical protein